MEPKIIKNEVDFKQAFTELERLMDAEPKSGSSDSERLKVLALLIEKYEKEQFTISKPDPIEAIKFRMEQQGLSNRDLTPILGSPSRVSEVLSKKRPLTLSMMRALHNKLDIPADVLLRGSASALPDNLNLDWTRFPIKEMISRGWIQTKLGSIYDRSEELMRDFLTPLGSIEPLSVLCRRTIHERTGREMDKYALLAWAFKIQMRALLLEPLPNYSSNIISEDFLKEVAGFSWSERGPLIAAEFLTKHGIGFILEQHLPGTYIDGASLFGKNGRPIVALSLRHDRLDNFWFCLLHELVHIYLHLNETSPFFVDDMDLQDIRDPKEIEADNLTSNIFIPRHRWKSSSAYQNRTAEDIEALAKELKIHVAIIAGRLRHETKNFHMFKQLVGHGEVRKLFEGTIWA